MYLPSVATSIALAYLILTFVKRQTRSGFPLQTAVVALVCVAMAVLTVHEARYWSDDIRLFNRAIVVGHDHGDAYEGLAGAYFSVHDIDNAERVGKLWVQNAMDPMGGWVTLAEVRRERKDYAGARDALQRALRSTKTPFGRVLPETQLGWLAQAEGNSSEAAYWYGLAAAEQPGVAMLHDMYGRALLQAGKTTEGEHELQIAQRLRRHKAL
jgi:tetratricopeptide (TPR) repeat protein